MNIPLAKEKKQSYTLASRVIATAKPTYAIAKKHRAAAFFAKAREKNFRSNETSRAADA